MTDSTAADLQAEIAALQERLNREREARELAPVQALSDALSAAEVQGLLDELLAQEGALTGERRQTAQDLLAALQIARRFFTQQCAVLLAGQSQPGSEG